MSKKKEKAAPELPVTVGVKGFDKDLKCRDHQFEVGRTETLPGEPKCCEHGFHAVENPLDVFEYYPPATSRYAIVEASGAVSRKDGGDTKFASASLKVVAEINLPSLISKGIEWITARIDKALEQTIVDGPASAASNTGTRSAASNTGYQSAASNTGYQSAASNTGDYSAASNTGDYSAASNTGDYSAASNTGTRSAASNTGDYSAASNTGTRSAASNTGDYSAASNTGKDSVAMASGYQGRAKACAGSAIVLCLRDKNYKLLAIKSSIVGENGIEPDVYYTLDSNGEFIKAQEQTP